MFALPSLARFVFRLCAIRASVFVPSLVCPSPAALFRAHCFRSPPHQRAAPYCDVRQTGVPLPLPERWYRSRLGLAPPLRRFRSCAGGPRRFPSPLSATACVRVPGYAVFKVRLKSLALLRFLGLRALCAYASVSPASATQQTSLSSLPPPAFSPLPLVSFVSAVNEKEGCLMAEHRCAPRQEKE